MPSNNWHIKKLGEVCELVIGRTPRRDTPLFWGGRLPWVAIRDLKTDIISETAECITELGVEKSRARLLPSGTLLYSFKLTIGKMAVAGVDLYTNEAIAGLIPRSSDDLSRDYLRYALRSVDPTVGSAHAVKGKTLNQETLGALEIPLPPLSEQRRIVEKLDAQMKEVDRARVAAEARLEDAKSLPSALLRSIFSPTKSERWPVLPLRNLLIENGQYGLSVKASYGGEGLPMLRMGNILTTGRIDWDDTKSATLSEREERQYLLAPGDILFNRTNSAELVGKTAVFDGVRPAVFASYLVRFRPHPEKADARFITAYINSQFGKKFIEQHMARAVGQVNISASIMHTMPIPVPPLADQRRIAAKLDEQMATAQHLIQRLTEEFQTLQSLPAALLREVFG